MDTLERLWAIEQIRQLKSRYFRFVDTKDWLGLESIFCEDAMFDTPGTRGGQAPVTTDKNSLRGRDAIVGYIREGMASSSSVHHGHGHEVTIDAPDEAHGIIALEDVVTWEHPRRVHLHGFGYYHEIYRTENGAWRIWRSTLTRIHLCDSLWS
jgi:SnoaL-like domain